MFVINKACCLVQVLSPKHLNYGLLKANAVGVLRDRAGFDDGPDPHEEPEYAAAEDGDEQLNDGTIGEPCVEVMDADASEEDGQEHIRDAILGA